MMAYEKGGEAFGEACGCRGTIGGLQVWIQSRSWIRATAVPHNFDCQLSATGPSIDITRLTLRLNIKRVPFDIRLLYTV